MSYPFINLAKNGYDVTPVKAMTKKAFLGGWTKPTKHNQKELKHWEDNSFSLGILTENNPAIDLDIRDKQFSQAMLEFCLNRLDTLKPIIRVGQEPKQLIVCRADVPFLKIMSKSFWNGEQKNQVEILGKGQQFVAFGIHPDTGNDYFYIDYELSNINYDELPLLTPEKAQEIINFFEDNIPDGWVCKEDEAKAFQVFTPKESIASLNGQLSPIDEYNRIHSVEDELLARGDKQKGKKFIYSDSDSGLAGISIKDGKMYSHHSGDPLGDGHAHDAFDVFCSRLGLSPDEGIKRAAEICYAPDGRTIDQYNKALYQQQNQNTVSSVPILNRFTQLSATNRLHEIEKNLSNDFYIFPDMALNGQTTLFYAWPNTGKTLFFLKFIIDAIISNEVVASNVFYINSDDHYKGLLTKARIAEKYGFHMISPAEAGVSSADIMDMLNELTTSNDATGKIIILDTLKKFTDLMNKQAQSGFYDTIRKLNAKNATVILAGHANKYKSIEGDLIPEGTQDTIDNIDCTYALYEMEKDDDHKVIEFRNGKSRGDVVDRVSYGYTKEMGASYYDLINSVYKLDEVEATTALIHNDIQNKSDKYESEIIFIKKVLNDKQLNQSEIIKIFESHRDDPEKTYHSLAGEFSMRNLKSALSELEGITWKVTRDFHNNAKKYELINGSKNTYLKQKTGDF